MDNPNLDIPITNTYALMVTSLIDMRWILRITATGKIELNPEVPQDEAVTQFVQICSDLLEKRQIAKP